MVEAYWNIVLKKDNERARKSKQEWVFINRNLNVQFYTPVYTFLQSTAQVPLLLIIHRWNRRNQHSNSMISIIIIFPLLLFGSVCRCTPDGSWPSLYEVSLSIALFIVIVGRCQNGYLNGIWIEIQKSECKACVLKCIEAWSDTSLELGTSMFANKVPCPVLFDDSWLWVKCFASKVVSNRPEWLHLKCESVW